MHKVAVMSPDLGPPKCLVCGRGNTADDPDTMDDFWVLDLERDVNWGDPAYICKYCCEKVAEQCGFVDVSAVEDLRLKLRDKIKEVHAAESERDSLKRRMKTIRRGSKALGRVGRKVA